MQGVSLHSDQPLSASATKVSEVTASGEANARRRAMEGLDMPHSVRPSDQSLDDGTTIVGEGVVKTI